MHFDTELFFPSGEDLAAVVTFGQHDSHILHGQCSEFRPNGEATRAEKLKEMTTVLDS